jgi:hypothetical protein
MDTYENEEIRNPTMPFCNNWKDDSLKAGNIFGCLFSFSYSMVWD